MNAPEMLTTTSTAPTCMPRANCEACGKGPAKLDDILCVDCSRAYGLLRDLLDEVPHLEMEDLDRIKDIFEWRMKKLQTVAARG